MHSGLNLSSTATPFSQFLKPATTKIIKSSNAQSFVTRLAWGKEQARTYTYINRKATLLSQPLNQYTAQSAQYRPGLEAGRLQDVQTGSGAQRAS
jgi:hypothetical protein